MIKLRVAKKTFLIIDAHAVLHRAYHALPPLTNKKREPVGAVFGFFSVLLSTLKEIKPQKLAVCFDSPAPTFRHREYIAYQAKRAKTEENLISQIKKTRFLIKKAKIASFSQKGFEADDLAATLAEKSRATKVYILTGDKDLMQLVNFKTSILLMQKQMSKFLVVEPEQVKKILGVKANQVVDYKALAGDSSDNYPGVPGIGPKTAVRLLRKFGRFEKIYRNLNKLPKAVRKKLEAGKEAGSLSLKLAQITTLAPLKTSLSQTVWKDDKIKALKEILNQEGFISLVKRIEKDFGLVKKENFQPRLL